jgi:SAM-dependent methyltransferase
MRILEIGPSYAPLAPRSAGWDVCVVDHATREELIEKYRDPIHGVDVSRIEDVDVVWREGPLDEALGPERQGFDVCLASHVIEHTPDLVGFVGGGVRTLSPDGRLSLAVPDLRYCFDLFRPPTRVGEVVAAHLRSASRHGIATLIDQQAYSARKAGHIAWSEAHEGVVELTGSLADVEPLVASGDDGDAPEYQDAHVWRFTPASFELLVLELSALGLLDVHIDSIHDTEGCEFFVKLRAGSRLPATAEQVDDVRLALLERSVREVGAVWATVGL